MVHGLYSAAVPPTVPAKRRAESLAENRARGPKTLNPPWRTNLLTLVPEPGLVIPPTFISSLPLPLSTSPALPPTPALSPTSPKPPACEPQDIGFLQPTSELALAATQQTNPPPFESSAPQRASPIQSSLAQQLSTSWPHPQLQMQPQLLQPCSLDFYQWPSAGFGDIGEFEAPQAGLTEEAKYPVTRGRRMSEYEPDLLVGSGAVAVAQVHRPSHPAPNTVSQSMARFPMVDIGPGSAANVGEIHWQRPNPAITQILPRANLGGMSALATYRLGAMSQLLHLRSGDLGQPQPMPHEDLQAPIAGGNGMGNFASVGADTCSTMAGELVERSDSHWSGTLEWPYTDPPFHAQVVTAEPMGNPCVHFLVEVLSVEDLRPCRLASTWPKVLSLGTTSYKVPINELEKWMKEKKAVLVRFEPASKSGEHNFAQLVEWLRKRKCVSRRCSYQAVL